MRYSKAVKNQAIKMYNTGQSCPKIAEELKVPKPTVYSWIQAKKAKKSIEKPAKVQAKETIIKEQKPKKGLAVKIKLLELENKALKEKIEILETLLD